MIKITQETTKIHINTDFPSVFLLNGTFSEKADSFSYPANEPLYITVLPLEAHLLPYTVKMLGAKSLYNSNLVASFSFEDGVFAKLLPRYNYMYEHKEPKNKTKVNATVPEKLFWAVKQNDFELAKKYCTDGLLETINEDGLAGFFDGFTAIMPDEFSSLKNNINNFTNQHYILGDPYYLINTNSVGALFYFELAEGLVDNIVEGNV